MKLNKILSIIFLFFLVSCGGNNNNNSNTNINNDILDKEKEEVPDIYKDYDDNNKETFDEVTLKIDVSLISEKTYEIKDGGTYLLTGTNSNLSIRVTSSDDIKLILSDLNLISLGESSPIYIDMDKDFTLYLAKNTKNYLKDSESNLLDAVLTCKGTNLNIEGEGYLIIDSLGISSETTLSGKGIHTSKTLNISSSHIIVNSSNDHAISAKKGISLENVQLDLTSLNDAIHSKEGGIEINESIIVSSSYGDGIDVASTVNINNSSLYITTIGEFLLYVASEDTTLELYEDSKYIYENGEYKKISSDDMSRYNTRYYLNKKCKGIKSDVEININGGKYIINSTDDAIASDTNINIYDGYFEISTLDQGINADQYLNIGKIENTSRNEDFNIYILNSYEGIQGGIISIYDAYIYIESTDDGINATSDTLTNVSMNFYNDTFINLRAEGDAIDSNGNITLNGGTLALFGPTSGGNGVLDFDNNFSINEGNMFAIGAIGMNENPTNVNQNTIYASINESFNKDSLLSLKVDDTYYSLLLPKSYNSLYLAFTSSNLNSGSSYNLIKGGSLSKEFVNNVYIGEASLTNGTSLYSGTISNTITNLGNSNNNPGGNFRPGGR